jgi:hypothetical protein
MLVSITRAARWSPSAPASRWKTAMDAESPARLSACGLLIRSARPSDGGAGGPVPGEPGGVTCNAFRRGPGQDRPRPGPAQEAELLGAGPRPRRTRATAPNTATDGQDLEAGRAYRPTERREENHVLARLQLPDAYRERPGGRGGVPPLHTELSLRDGKKVGRGHGPCWGTLPAGRPAAGSHQQPDAEALAAGLKRRAAALGVRLASPTTSRSRQRINPAEPGAALRGVSTTGWPTSRRAPVEALSYPAEQV